MSDAPGATANSTCPNCGAAFRCGMEAGDAECWCASLPPADLPAPAGDAPASCWCPACLAKRIAGAGTRVGAGGTARDSSGR